VKDGRETYPSIEGTENPGESAAPVESLKNRLQTYDATGKVGARLKADATRPLARSSIRERQRKEGRVISSETSQRKEGKSASEPLENSERKGKKGNILNIHWSTVNVTILLERATEGRRSGTLQQKRVRRDITYDSGDSRPHLPVLKKIVEGEARGSALRATPDSLTGLQRAWPRSSVLRRYPINERRTSDRLSAPDQWEKGREGSYSKGGTTSRVHVSGAVGGGGLS